MQCPASPNRFIPVRYMVAADQQVSIRLEMALLDSRSPHIIIMIIIINYQFASLFLDPQFSNEDHGGDLQLAALMDRRDDIAGITHRWNQSFIS